MMRNGEAINSIVEATKISKLRFDNGILYTSFHCPSEILDLLLRNGMRYLIRLNKLSNSVIEVT